MRKLISGVGICEIGDYPVKSKAQSVWASMIERCYSVTSKHYKDQTYIGVTVSEDFKEFQKWVSWAKDQIGFDKAGWHFDKDLLVKGNRMYSKDTCVFIPAELNLLINRNKGARKNCCIGVVWRKVECKFRAQLNYKGKTKQLGQASSMEAAFLMYKKGKESYIKEMAEKWKDEIDPRAYEALINYKVEIGD